MTMHLIELHWLPIHWRIQYKLNVLMHGIITGKCPDYLQTIVQPVTSPHPGLRSAACPSPKFVTSMMMMMMMMMMIKPENSPA